VLQLIASRKRIGLTNFVRSAPRPSHVSCFLERVCDCKNQRLPVHPPRRYRCGGGAVNVNPIRVPRIQITLHS
jgi:hypothetical protein